MVGSGGKHSTRFFSFPVSLEPNNWKPHFPLPFSSPIAILALLQPTQHKSLFHPKEQTPYLQMTSTATPPITTTTPTTTNLVRALPQWAETAIWGASGPTTRGKGGETSLNIMTRNASHQMTKIVKMVQEGCSVERQQWWSWSKAVDFSRIGLLWFPGVMFWEIFCWVICDIVPELVGRFVCVFSSFTFKTYTKTCLKNQFQYQIYPFWKHILRGVSQTTPWLF